MKEQEFTKQYKEELQTMHAPKDLIARTKKMAAGKKRGRYRNTRYIAFATTAAAAVLFCVLLLPGMLKTAEKGNEGTKIHLGKWEDGKELYLEEQVSLDRVMVLPLAFMSETAWSEEVFGVEVQFAIEEDESYTAAFWENDAYVVISSGITDKEEFRKMINTILSE